MVSPLLLLSLSVVTLGGGDSNLTVAELIALEIIPAKICCQIVWHTLWILYGYSVDNLWMALWILYG